VQHRDTFSVVRGGLDLTMVLVARSRAGGRISGRKRASKTELAEDELLVLPGARQRTPSDLSEIFLNELIAHNLMPLPTDCRFSEATGPFVRRLRLRLSFQQGNAPENLCLTLLCQDFTLPLTLASRGFIPSLVFPSTMSLLWKITLLHSLCILRTSPREHFS
jgi:hypothetical protein